MKPRTAVYVLMLGLLLSATDSYASYSLECVGVVTIKSIPIRIVYGTLSRLAFTVKLDKKRFTCNDGRKSLGRGIKKVRLNINSADYKKIKKGSRIRVRYNVSEFSSEPNGVVVKHESWTVLKIIAP